MWKQLTIGVVVILVVGLIAGAFVKAEEIGDNNAEVELTIHLENAETGETHSLSIMVPTTISVTQEFLAKRDISSLGTFSTTDSTDLYPSDEIRLWASASCWWTTDDIDTMTSIRFTQSGETKDSGDIMFYDEDHRIEEIDWAERNPPTQVSESDPYIIPGSDHEDLYFDRWGTETSTYTDPLTAEKADGGSISGTVELKGTEVGTGDTITATTSVSAIISLDITEPDGTISLSAEISSVNYEEQ